MLPAPPVVVDADVLLRNVDYQLRRGWAAALSDAATGTNIFAAIEVRAEVLKHLPDIATRRGVKLSVVVNMWSTIASRIRFVALSKTAAEGDPRLVTVDPKDLPTARLACVLAPAVLCTDNQRHFPEFFADKYRVDPIAIDLRTLAQLDLGVRGVMIFPTVAVASTAHAARDLARLVGRDTALLVGVGIVALTAVAVGPDRARSARGKLADIGRELGPPLSEFIARAQLASDRVQGVTVPPGEVPLALNLVARRMRGPFDTLTTSEVATLLTDAGFVFEAGGRHATATRAWLVSEPCFAETSRGRWSFATL